jgi:hypothetical protein
METIARLKGDLAQALASASSSSAAAAVTGLSPYSHAHDVANIRAAVDDSTASGHVQRLRCDGLPPTWLCECHVTYSLYCRFELQQKSLDLDAARVAAAKSQQQACSNLRVISGIIRHVLCRHSTSRPESLNFSI